MTLGETRVRTKFNPSDLDNVSLIKQKTAELINLLEAERSKGPQVYISGGQEEFDDKERQRLISIAQTEFETAAMYAVKACTV